jgi:F5/8 type C domain
MRKRLMSEQVSKSADRPGEIDVASLAMFGYSSEDPDHPLEHLIDGHRGRGGTRWASARPNTTEHIELEFEPPQQISRLVYEVEECHVERTQQVRVEVSTDHGRTYRQLLAQDYTFSPEGATFQHEELQLDVRPITHLQLTIIPNKGGSGVATLTSLRLFARLV